MRNCPVYILDLNRILVVASDGRRDMTHPQFWERHVARLVADHHGFPPSLILNAPYCQRRGRVVGRRLFYCGESLSDTDMNSVRTTLGYPELRLVYDEHHQRLDYDVAILRGAIDRSR